MPSSASEVPSPERTDQVEVSQCDYTLAFLVFTAYLSFQENRRFLLVPRVVLKPLVSLIGRLVDCSARISVDTTHSTDTNQAVTLAAHARREGTLERARTGTTLVSS